MRKSFLFILSICLLSLTGCAIRSVPLATLAQTNNVKQFTLPSSDKAGLYIYRSSIIGGGLKKDIWVNNQCVGQSNSHIFFYREVPGDQEITITTESEFSPNELKLMVQGGENYFIEQYTKMGVFVYGANVRIMDSEVAKEIIKGLNMGIGNDCTTPTP